MTQLPRRNLQPEADAWGRKVADITVANQKAVTRLEQSTSNDLKAINATINRMTQQIQELQTTQTELAQTQSDLSLVVQRISESTELITGSFTYSNSSGGSWVIPNQVIPAPTWATYAHIDSIACSAVSTTYGPTSNSTGLVCVDTVPVVTPGAHRGLAAVAASQNSTVYTTFNLQYPYTFTVPSSRSLNHRIYMGIANSGSGTIDCSYSFVIQWF